MSLRFICTALFVSLLGTPALVAADERADQGTAEDKTYRIDAIVVEGLFFTKPHVVTRELLFAEGEITTVAEIEESIQRLRNLGIFRIAEYELLDRRVPLPDGRIPKAQEQHRILLISVDERWTLIPFGTFASGGGTFSLTTGLYDVNAFGSLIELGAQYQRFANTNSFAIWGGDPRLFGERLSLSGSVAQTNRINVFYDDAGELEGGHLRLRQSGSVSLSREWIRWLRTSVSLSFARDRYSIDILGEELAELESERGLPPDTDHLATRFSLNLGRIDSNSFLRKGLVWGNSIVGAIDGFASNIGYTDVGSQVAGFVLLPLRSNFGFRTGLGITTTDRPEYQFFVGGLNVIRGFLHRRFRGSHYWYSNAELRVPSIDTRWLVIQHVGFLDAAGVADSLQVLQDVDGVAGGVGVRILSPKIFSLIARFDYAWSIVGDGTSSISFGAGQFF